MPSFLNKVFGYKKNDEKEATHPAREPSDSTLLDGKYEAIPSVLSPTASAFPPTQQTKDTDRDGGFSLFKPKYRGFSQKSTQKQSEAVPFLTLRLPGPKECTDSRALNVVFEADPNSQTILDDAAIAEKRLNPLEALILIRACAHAITERGLETLGVMHPHWFSASPDVQRKLISLFIHSLAPQSRTTTLSPTTSSPVSAFENELRYTRSPHDVAAVLRWGIRHLSLENGYFGKGNAEWAWYNTFFRAERNGSYPSKAFSELLLPQLPAPHIELLTSTLGLVSSLASHAESNGISGSKLSKFWGIWLLLASRAEQSDDWNRFYARWERAGRVLEHLFLVRLREESFGQRLPTRLQELVKYYPYNKDSVATQEELLSRPRFSTRQFDALFVRIETLLTPAGEQPKQHPIQILLEAFQLPVENLSMHEHTSLWNALKTKASEDLASSDPEGPQLTRIFVDETIRLLSLIPVDNDSPTSSSLLTSPITKAMSRKRSSSFTRALERTAPISTIQSTPVSPTSPSSIVVTDWAQFSLNGFGNTPSTQPLAAVLDQDDDIEITQPRISPKSSRRRGKSRTRRRRSEDNEPLETLPSSQSKAELSIVETKLASVHVIQIDEAFIDFWSDAIVDPISADWPPFVVCGLKQIPGVESIIRWLVIEQTYARQSPQSPRIPSPDGHRGRSPRPSFKSDISGFRINSMFSSARKRFSILTKSATDLDLRRSGGRTPTAGEFGDALVEEELTLPPLPSLPPLPPVPPTKGDYHSDRNAVVGAAVTSGVTANVADQLKADDIFSVPIASVPPADLEFTSKKESDLVQPTEKAPSVEPTPQSGASHDGFSVPPQSPVRTSEEVASVEQGSPRTADVTNAKANAADPIATTAPLQPDTLDLPSTEGTSDPAVLASEPALTVENPVTKEVHAQAKEVRQDEDQLVEVGAQLSDGHERPPAESTAEPFGVTQVDVADSFQEAAEGVAVPPVPESVVGLLATPIVSDKAPERIAQEPRVVEKPSRKVSTECVAASTVASTGQRAKDDLPSASAPGVRGSVTAIEPGPRPEPHSIASAIDGAEEATDVAEYVEIPTSAPQEFVAVIEVTPGQEVPADECNAPARRPAVELEAFEDAPVITEVQVALEAEEESVVHPTEGLPAEIVPAAEASAEVVTDRIERGTNQVPGPTLKVALPLVQDDVQAQEASFVGTQDTVPPTPVLQDAASADKTSVPSAGTHDLIGVVEDKAPEPSTETIAEANIPLIAPSTEGALPCLAAEPSTQFVNTRAAQALSAKYVREGTTAALGTADEIIPPEVNAQSTSGAFPNPDCAPIEDTLEVAVGAGEPVANEVAEPVEESLICVEGASPSTSEAVDDTPTFITEDPVSQDIQVPIEIGEPSNEPAPQSADEVANAPIVAVAVPEEMSSVKMDAPLELEVVDATVDTVNGSHEVVEDAKPISLAPKARVLAEESRAVVGAGEPPVRVVEAVQVPVEVEDPSPAPVEAAEEVVASRSLVPVVEIAEICGADVPQEAARPVE